MKLLALPTFKRQLDQQLKRPEAYDKFFCEHRLRE